VLQVNSNTLQHVEQFKYLGWYLRVKESIRRLIHRLINHLTKFYVWFIVKKLSNTAKPSVFKSVLVPIFVYSHQFLVMTERMLFQRQEAEIGDLRRVHLRDIVRSCEIRIT